MSANDTVLMHPTSALPIYQEACAPNTDLGDAITWVLGQLIRDGTRLQVNDLVITIKNYEFSEHAAKPYLIEVWRSVESPLEANHGEHR